MSTETANAQTADLYDFLYRDWERISSYYAQIRNGRIAWLESDVTPERGNRRIPEMHDTLTVDLLLPLTARKSEDDPAGSIRLFTGTCFFLDRNILQYAGAAIDLAAQSAASTVQRKGRKRNPGEEYANPVRAGKNQAAVITHMAINVGMPSGFVLRTESEVAVCGPIKESGLDQPISSLLFRAGNLGLANCHVIGLVEELSDGGMEPFSPIHLAQMQMADAFQPVLFPQNATRMIPLAIYRKISI